MAYVEKIFIIKIIDFETIGKTTIVNNKVNIEDIFIVFQAMLTNVDL